MIELGPNEVLRVTPEGKFIWAENADETIEKGDFTAAPAMPHILRALRLNAELVGALRQIEVVSLADDWLDGPSIAKMARHALARVEASK